MQIRRPALVGALALAALLGCSGSDSDGTSPPVPEAMQKTAGDNQSGAPGATLSQPLEVKVTDGSGRAVVGFTVSFSASAGTLNPQSDDTDNNGRARTILTLPAEEAEVTITASGPGLADVQFTARAEAPPIELTTTALVAGRRGLPYPASLEASGGVESAYSFSLGGGALPAGLSLNEDGTFEGEPTETGSFTFTARVSDGQKEASRQLSLEVCELPAPLAPGELLVTDPAGFGECGIFLPAGNAGDRYRVGVIRTTNAANPSDFETVTLTVTGNGVTPAAPALAARLPGGAGRARLDPALLRRASRMLQATAEAHVRAQAEAVSMLRRLGPRAVQRAPAPGLRAPAGAPLPPKLRLDVGRSPTCQPGEQVTAVLVAEDDRMAVYQDSTQNASSVSRVTPQMANLLLAYYRDYGRRVIHDYFGAPGDIDGNGKIIVFITPSIGGNTLGLVWSGNFFSKAECPASNAGEYIYLNSVPVTELTDPDLTFALGLYALVHEVKHVTSMYQRILRAAAGPIDYHPTWEEEGGAEIAAERAARMAWAQSGGPPLTATVVRQHLVPENESEEVIDSENVAMLFMLLRTQETLSAQPNSVVVGPSGAPSDYIYGSGWLFLRFLGDAYGNAGSASHADADFFRTLHDRTTASGYAGITAETGRSWPQLMEEFLAASMVNGQPNVMVPRAFTSYDFVSAVETYCFALDPRFVGEGESCRDDDGEPLPAGAPGAFPWPVTTDDEGEVLTRGLVSSTWSGSAGPSGMRVHDFTSNGSGHGAEINVDADASSRVVVVRLK